MKKEYFQLLAECSDIDHHSHFSDIKKKLSSDARYKAVESSTSREDWFREHVKRLKDERKREKERERRDKRDERRKGDKEREKREESVERDRKSEEPHSEVRNRLI